MRKVEFEGERTPFDAAAIPGEGRGERTARMAPILPETRPDEIEFDLEVRLQPVLRQAPADAAQKPSDQCPAGTPSMCGCTECGFWFDEESSPLRAGCRPLAGSARAVGCRPHGPWPADGSRSSASTSPAGRRRWSRDAAATSDAAVARRVPGGGGPGPAPQAASHADAMSMRPGRRRRAASARRSGRGRAGPGEDGAQRVRRHAARGGGPARAASTSWSLPE